MFGSKLITHDIINKSYDTQIYNYLDNFENESHIVGGGTAGTPEFPLASALEITTRRASTFGGGRWLRVSDFPARTFVMPTSLSGGVDSQHTTPNNTNPYMAYDPHKWVQRRNSQMVQLENALNVNILVHGNTLINAGDKVILNLPYISSRQIPLASPSNDNFDRFYKGPFLIKRIRHDFIMTSSPQKHRMYMSLVKDSLEEELMMGGPVEPSADNSAGIEECAYKLRRYTINNKNSRTISNKQQMKRKFKMTKTKNRIKKMTFQTQDRKYEPLSENDKYIIDAIGYRKQELRGQLDEDISRITGRVVRPQYI